MQSPLDVDASVTQDPGWERETGARARVGTTLRGKWRIDALLGVGGTASVYSATHRNGIAGAVKVLHPAHARDELTRERFLREGFVANLVEHAGAVHVIDDDETEEGLPFLVMELLDGKALNELAAASGGTIEPERVLLLVDQMLDALIAVHDAGVVHRDLKPENVFLTRDGRVKLLDFGIAHMPVGPRSSPRATQVGMPMGSPAFMPPEQARGRWDLVGPQSDLWAVGATMFTLLTGRFVHDGVTSAEVLIAAGSQAAPALSTVAPRIPASVAELVDRALQMRLADRWEDARSMREAVQAAFREMTGLPLPTTPPKSFAPVCRPAPAASNRHPRASVPGPREAATMDSADGPARRAPRAWRIGGALALGLSMACATVVARGTPGRPLDPPTDRAAPEALSVAPPTPLAPPEIAAAEPPAPAPIGADPPREPPHDPPKVVPAFVPPAPSSASSARAPLHQVDLKSLYDRRM